MSLYTPPSFALSDQEQQHQLIRDYPFATLITSVAGQEPRISHLPLLLEADGSLSGHLARANPHWQAFAEGETVAVFHGPHAYVSPRWYVNPAREVPTWNYAVVHVHGRPELDDDAGFKLSLLDRTSAAFEPAVGGWTRQLDAARQNALLNAIVAFRLRPSRIEGKRKINQNKTSADRAQVAAQLRASAHPELLTMAAWMEALDVR